MSNGHRWAAVGDEMLKFLAPAYQSNGDLHWPTLVAGTAALAGEMALLGRLHELPEEGVVKNEKVTEFIHDTKAGHRSLWTYMLLIADQAYGVQFDTLPGFKHVLCNSGSTLLPGSFPALDVPVHVMPQETPLNAGPKTRKSVMAIATHHGMDTTDAAFCLATAAMKTVGFGRELGLRDMCALALECMVAGARFVPLEKPATNPAFGSVGDLLPRTGSTSIQPPRGNDRQEALWGTSSVEDEDDVPETVAEPAHEDIHEHRVAFGRRR